MNTIYALYPDPDSAQLAFSGLRATGVEARDIAVVSSEPFEGYEFFDRHRKTPMPWLATLGGILGGAGGYLIAALTQQAYPLPTGGMPIVSAWTDGIITYEMTMLGAVLATVLTLLFAARLPNWRRQLYDPEISDGKILIGVFNPPESSRGAIQKSLLEAGAARVKDFGTRSGSPASLLK